LEYLPPYTDNKLTAEEPAAGYIKVLRMDFKLDYTVDRKHMNESSISC